MHKFCVLFALLFTAALFSTLSAGEDSILGEWISVQRSQGGLGGAKTYGSEGIVTATYGALVDFKYKVDGSKLTISFPREADIVQSYQREGNRLIITDASGRKQELTRIAGDAESGIVGSWTGDHYTGQKQTLEFTDSGNLYLSVPAISANGFYEIKGDDLLTESFEGKDRKEWRWTIKDGVLTLRDTAGKSETYLRKK